MYAHALKKLIPDFESEAPLERKITHERISLMAPDANMTIDFSSDAMDNPQTASYSVLRAPFDQWLAEKAEQAGAEFIYGIPVEGLVKDEAGKVIGVKAGEDEITANVVVLADGVNSLLAKEAVGYDKPPANQMAVGVKEVFELPASTITGRSISSIRICINSFVQSPLLEPIGAPSGMMQAAPAFAISRATFRSGYM